MKKIVGYRDKISAAPDDTIRFMVSCDGPTSYRADLVRIIHGDLNPEGPGLKEKVIAGVGGDEHRGRKQEVYAGSRRHGRSRSRRPPQALRRRVAGRCAGALGNTTAEEVGVDEDNRRTSRNTGPP